MEQEGVEVGVDARLPEGVLNLASGWSGFFIAPPASAPSAAAAARLAFFSVSFNPIAMEGEKERHGVSASVLPERTLDGGHGGCVARPHLSEGIEETVQTRECPQCRRHRKHNDVKKTATCC